MSVSTDTLSSFLSSIGIMISIINVLVHIVFASAVARDAGKLVKIGRPTYLVSGIAWAFATLVGGVFIAGLYWIMHYSTLARGQGG
jgi:hypothetical protein